MDITRENMERARSLIGCLVDDMTQAGHNGQHEDCGPCLDVISANDFLGDTEGLIRE